MPLGILLEISSWSQNPGPQPTIAANYPNDGQILSSKSWKPLPNLDSLDDFARNYFSKAVYEEARLQKDFDILEITYSSDGLPVHGMLIKPKILGARKWPAMIFNRGGTGDYSGITDDGDPPPPSDVLRVMISALDQLAAAERQRMNSPGLSEDELSDLENDLTYIAGVSQLLHQMPTQT